MKKVLPLLALSTFCFNVNAQIKQGSIVFEKKINMYRRITDENMRNYVGEFRTSKHVLTFSDSISNYKPLVELEQSDAGEGGNRIMMGFGGGAESTEMYKNYSTHKFITLTDFSNVTYNITDTINNLTWIKKDETKVILGFTCHKAVAKQKQPARRAMTMMLGTNGQAKTDSIKQPQKVEEKEIEIVAWYTNDLLTPAGPEQYGGLPGATLMIDVDNGETVYTALEMDKKVGKKELNEPTKGKKVTKAEMRDIQMKMFEKMRQNGGSGGMGNIRVISGGN